MQTPPESPRLEATSNGQDPRIGLVLADNIKLIRVLGTGAYGTVYQAQDITTGEAYAVKALNKLGLDARQHRFQKREVELHYRASCHPNVLSMYRIIDSADCTYVVLEYCPEGDLFAKITEEGHYIRDDAKACSVFLQLLKAVQYCHSHNIYHRDLKPENIMVTDNGSSIRLADFGLATTEHISRDFGCGSTFYMSPECQESNPRPSSWYRSAANDVWSLGVILVNLTCGRNPWKRASDEDPTFRAFLKDPNFLRTILPISEELNVILRLMFEVDPLKRITVPQLIACMERFPTLTESTTAPLSPPRSPVEDIVQPSWPAQTVADQGLKPLPANLPRLPQARYASSRQQYYTTPSVQYPHTSQISPLSGSLASSPEYNYTSQARTQFNYNIAPAQQYWNGWNTGVYATQQYFYPAYAPAYSAVY